MNCDLWILTEIVFRILKNANTNRQHVLLSMFSFMILKLNVLITVLQRLKRNLTLEGLK